MKASSSFRMLVLGSLALAGTACQQEQPTKPVPKVQVPVSPAASVIPKIGDALEKIGATISCRVEVEGYLDVVSYQGDIKVAIY